MATMADKGYTKTTKGWLKTT